MGIGAYRHVVTLTHPRVAIVPPTWHCAIESSFGQVVDGLAAFIVRGRYHGGITLDTRIAFEGGLLAIQGIDDVDQRHVEMRLVCVEAVARGREPIVPVAAPTYQETVLADGASAYWPLDDPAGSTTARDLAGTLTGDVMGSVVLGVPGPGPVATAARFAYNTFDAYVKLALTTIPRSATIEAWFRQGWADRDAMIFSNAWAPDVAVRLYINAANFLGIYIDAQGVNTALGADGLWHHVVALIDAPNDTLTLSLDGVAGTPFTALSLATDCTSTAATLGGNDDNVNYFWDGDLADVAIYPRVLTATEIAAHYALRSSAGRRR